MTKQKQTIGRATTHVRWFRPKPLLGAWDAWNLLAASGAAVAALPLFAGNLPAAATGLGLSVLGGAGLAWPRVRDWLDPVDAEPREGFVLPSDPVLADDDDGPLSATRATRTRRCASPTTFSCATWVSLAPPVAGRRRSCCGFCGNR